MAEQVKIVFVLGPPGAGKGSLCDKIVSKYGYVHLSIKRLLQKEIEEESDLGRAAQDVLDQGGEIPTEIILEMVASAMQSSVGARGFVLDGFPRDLEQLNIFQEEVQPCDAALVLTIPEDMAVARVMDRLAQERAEPLGEESALEMAAAKLEEYQAQTGPVVEALRDSGLPLFEMEVTGTDEEVFYQVTGFFDELEGLPINETPTAADMPVVSSEEVAAAIQIQRVGRGMLARKRVQELKAQQSKEVPESAEVQAEPEEAAEPTAAEEAQESAEEPTAPMANFDDLSQDLGASQNDLSGVVEEGGESRGKMFSAGDEGEGVAEVSGVMEEEGANIAVDSGVLQEVEDDLSADMGAAPQGTSEEREPAEGAEEAEGATTEAQGAQEGEDAEAAGADQEPAELAGEDPAQEGEKEVEGAEGEGQVQTEGMVEGEGEAQGMEGGKVQQGGEEGEQEPMGQSAGMDEADGEEQEEAPEPSIPAISPGYTEDFEDLSNVSSHGPDAQQQQQRMYESAADGEPAEASAEAGEDPTAAEAEETAGDMAAEPDQEATEQVAAGAEAGEEEAALLEMEAEEQELQKEAEAVEEQEQSLEDQGAVSGDQDPGAEVVESQDELAGNREDEEAAMAVDAQEEMAGEEAERLPLGAHEQEEEQQEQEMAGEGLEGEQAEKDGQEQGPPEAEGQEGEAEEARGEEGEQIQVGEVAAEAAVEGDEGAAETAQEVNPADEEADGTGEEPPLDAEPAPEEGLTEAAAEETAVEMAVEGEEAAEVGRQEQEEQAWLTDGEGGELTEEAAAELAAVGQADRYTAEEIEQAAIKIQAAGRGMVARKRVAKIKEEKLAAMAIDERTAEEEGEEAAAPAQEGREEEQVEEEAEQGDEEVEVEEEVGGMSLEEQNAAVVKIQAVGRGMLARKKVAAVKKAKEEIERLVAVIPSLLVVSGPSGVGKGTLIAALMAAHGDRFGFVVSHTTRGPRPGEVNGQHYHFSTREIMEEQISLGLFLESAAVHSNLYGTSLAAVADVCKSGKIPVLDIDVQGAAKVRSSQVGHRALRVFIAPPSLEELERRLRGRGTETEEKVQLRLNNAAGEIAAAALPGAFDVTVVNADIESALAALKEVIEARMPGTFPPEPPKPSSVRANSRPSSSALPPPATLTPSQVDPYDLQASAPSPAPPAPNTYSAPNVPSIPPPVQPPASTTSNVFTLAPQSAPTNPPSGFGPGTKLSGIPTVRQYMDATVVPVLREAMRALNEQRPEDPLGFLANFLLQARDKGRTRAS